MTSVPVRADALSVFIRRRDFKSSFSSSLGFSTVLRDVATGLVVADGPEFNRVKFDSISLVSSSSPFSLSDLFKIYIESKEMNVKIDTAIKETRRNYSRTDCRR